MTLDGNAQFGYAQGNVAASFSEGFDVSGEVVAVRGEVEGKVGGGLLNVGAKAEAGSAQGRLAVHFEDRNNYTIGFKGSASAVSASMDISSSLLSMRRKEDDKPVELFGFEAEPKAKKGASATAMLSSKTVYEIGRVNINATTLELGGAIGLGINLRLTIPSISFDFW